MKKLIAIFLLTFYTATTFGVTLNFHYCGGHLNQVSLLSLSNKVVCSCGLGTMSKGCCQDKVVYQKTDKHKTVQQSFTFTNFEFSIILPVTINHLDYHLISNGDDSNNVNYYLRHSKSLVIPIHQVYSHIIP